MSESKLAMVKNDVVDVVEKRVRNMYEQGQIELPKNYAVGNAMKAAWLELQSTKTKNDEPVLEACTNNSIANALLEMVINGLNPAKDQVDFIAYGKHLNCQPSRFGNEYLVKSRAGARDVNAQAVYEKDEFEYEILPSGRTKIKKHKQTIKGKLESDIIAGYAVIEFEDDRPDYAEVMTIDQIRKAWSQGNTYKGEKGDSPHTNFSEEMVKKTVTNRTCKAYIRSSDDANMVKAQEVIDSGKVMQTEQEAQQEIKENANSEVIDIDEAQEEQHEDQKTDSEPEQKKQKNQNNQEKDKKEEPKQQQMAMAGTGPDF